MAAPLALVLAGATTGWVTQMQSKYGVRPETIARMFNGTQDTKLTSSYETLGYYWHHPVLSDDHRGLGGGIAWAFDDDLCKDDGDSYIGNGVFEDQFKEDFFFAPFVTCVDIRASLHRAFKTWTDVHPLIRFVDVTEECRRLYGAVFSNCSLVEVFVTQRNNVGMMAGVKSYTNVKTQTVDGKSVEVETVVQHPRPWPYMSVGDTSPVTASTPYPGGSFEAHPNALPEGLTECGVVGEIPNSASGSQPCDTTTGRRKLTPQQAEEPEITESFAGVAAASATQYGRFATDLRSTNGKVQKYSIGAGITLALSPIEAFGGTISFNTEKCWYLDTAFCGPLHTLKAKMGTSGAAAMIQGVAFGILALALLVFFMLIARVMKHQHCCTSGKKRTFKQKARGSAEEMSAFGVLPTLVLVICLWVPIALHQTILAPCWECYDFEAAAVHEIGHILGLNHPDSIAPRMNGDVPYPTGSNSFSYYTAANSGMKPYDSKGFPSDICMNPWEHVIDGVYDEADDKNDDTGVRQSIMYSLTEHNPKVCLTSDDIEAIYTIYPVCDGRAMPTSTGLLKGEGGNEREGLMCYKTHLYIGAVRVLIYIFVPILFFMTLQLLILACLKHHQDEVLDELQQSRTKAVNVAARHKKSSIEAQNKAVKIQDALNEQIATEDARVEERAQEMAATMLQAKLRGNMTRKATASNFGAETAAKMAAAGKSGKM